jgi:hypothetical protein
MEERRVSPGKRKGSSAGVGRGAALALVLIAGGGCESTFTAPQPASQVDVAPDLDERLPVEVAILPLQLPAIADSEEAADLTEALYGELLRKAYTPLDTDYVRSRVPPRPAGGPPEIGALRAAVPVDAFLLVELLKSDLENRDRSPRYRLYARAWLFDGASGTTLFRHELNQAYSVSLEGSGTLSSAVRRDKLKLFAGQLLNRLPLRRERP